MFFSLFFLFRGKGKFSSPSLLLMVFFFQGEGNGVRKKTWLALNFQVAKGNRRRANRTDGNIDKTDSLAGKARSDRPQVADREWLKEALQFDGKMVNWWAANASPQIRPVIRKVRLQSFTIRTELPARNRSSGDLSGRGFVIYWWCSVGAGFFNDHMRCLSFFFRSPSVAHVHGRSSIRSSVHRFSLSLVTRLIEREFRFSNG